MRYTLVVNTVVNSDQIKTPNGFAVDNSLQGGTNRRQTDEAEFRRFVDNVGLQSGPKM